MKLSKHAGANMESYCVGVSEQQARREADVLRLKLLGVLDAVMREKWLPMGLRAFVAQELPVLRRAAARAEERPEALAARARALADDVVGYGRYTLQSETVARIQALAAELSAGRAA